MNDEIEVVGNEPYVKNTYQNCTVLGCKKKYKTSHGLLKHLAEKHLNIEINKPESSKYKCIYPNCSNY